MEHHAGREAAHLGSPALLQDVEGRELYVEAEGAVSALGHDVEVDGVGLDALLEELHLLAVGRGIFGFGAAVGLDADDGAQREEDGAVQEFVGLPLEEQGHGEVDGLQPREVEVGTLGAGHDAYLTLLFDEVAVFVHDVVAPVDAQSGNKAPTVVVNGGVKGNEIPKNFKRIGEVERDPVG